MSNIPNYSGVAFADGSEMDTAWNYRGFYSSSQAYYAGDVVRYNNQLVRFTTYVGSGTTPGSSAYEALADIPSDTGWLACSITGSGWSSGGTTPSARMRNGIVSLRGSFINSSFKATANTLVGKLPSFVTPPATSWQLATPQTSTVLKSCMIDTDGSIYMACPSATTSSASYWLQGNYPVG